MRGSSQSNTTAAPADLPKKAPVSPKGGDNGGNTFGNCPRIKSLGGPMGPGVCESRSSGQRVLSSPTLSTARNASCGMSTLPIRFMRFLPSFCFSRSFRLREMSPP